MASSPDTTASVITFQERPFITFGFCRMANYSSTSPITEKRSLTTLTKRTIGENSTARYPLTRWIHQAAARVDDSSLSPRHRVRTGPSDLWPHASSITIPPSSFIKSPADIPVVCNIRLQQFWGFFRRKPLPHSTYDNSSSHSDDLPERTTA